MVLDHAGGLENARRSSPPSSTARNGRTSGTADEESME
jgi:hypothetical protein